MDMLKLNKEVNYLNHELCSVTSRLNYILKYYLNKDDKRFDLDKAVEYIKHSKEQIENIQDYFYKQLKEKDLV